MKNFKEKWEITHNWQLLFPVLGILLSMGCGYLIARNFFAEAISDTTTLFLLVALSLIIGYIIILLSLFFFRKLKNRWKVNARWEYIAIFIVFAITGSTAGRISHPVMDFLGIGSDEISGFIYWPLRIIIIFPLYQILLLVFAWLFGQFNFFYEFEKRMLSKMGLRFLFSKS
ncbi:DUF6787 family protein [Leeuwenhoekiella sp. A16]|uniref:DUF6787 family protein n=1 Tax=unclassified Leeuwenhoekiella TaxID=2615029 RepID=UPI003A80882B